ncbi:MAG TPA: DUF502 domain-containing protein [Steroidobacteraceae bacterium]|nr:DUF502 domain-containing protein [Steroidobacteraceae bacterium]
MAEGSGSEHRRGRTLRNYLIAGLLIWIPIFITVVVFRFLVNLMDQTLLLLPGPVRPENLLGFKIPGLGVVLTIVLLAVTGLVATNLIGGRLVTWIEGLVRRIPFIGPVYGGAKSFSETVLTSKGQSFKKVLLIQYPRVGVWSLAFLTSNELEEVQARTDHEVVCCFVPTTPNPTSGFIVMVPRKDVIELDMEVESAVKMIVTLGVVVPRWNKRPGAQPLAPPEAAP